MYIMLSKTRGPAVGPCAPTVPASPTVVPVSLPIHGAEGRGTRPENSGHAANGPGWRKLPLM